MNMRLTRTLLFLAVLPATLRAQQAATDTLKDTELRGVTISAYRLAEQRVERLPDIRQTYLFTGKKSEVIDVSGLNANLAEKTGRQIFAKVPGVFVYDMDGSGNQVNISTRGLDPHRSWEFNVRHNGVLVNSDMYGYPASHFSSPLESIERIELVRGGGSLQYGAQFGGMINYVSKSPDTSRAIGFEQQTTVGSYGLFSSYSALGGQTGKLTYYAYYHKRTADGYRAHSRSDGEAHFGQLTWRISRTARLRAELAHSRYHYQLPGPLTDAMFAANPRQATRARNYYSPDIYVPSLTLDWQLSAHTALHWTASAVYGARNSVMFDRFATVGDTVNAVTGDYNARQVDIDNFRSHTTELRLLHRYRLGGVEQALAVGGQFMLNNMHRRQQGQGTTGFDYDLTLTGAGWGRDLWYRTRNAAVFAENTFYLGPRLALSPGFRVEAGETRATGSIRYYNPEDVPNAIRHRYPLFGVSGKFQLDAANQVYAGWSQGYRPVIFKDIIPASVLERADKNLRDATGYTVEAGTRGTLGRLLRYDVGGFCMLYRHRLGNLLRTDPSTDETYIYKTNIGDSRTWGVEFFAEATPVRRNDLALSFFTSTSWFDARYLDAVVVTGTENRSVKGNRVEGVPQWISRNGANVAWRRWSASLLYSYVGEHFADALNTAEPSANAARGLVPAYGLFDANAAYRFRDRLTLRAAVSNLLNRSYYTKRPTFYPGPGIWPSDGRSMQLSATVRI
jgi:Fe(3+) dicitrate transport protein